MILKKLFWFILILLFLGYYAMVIYVELHPEKYMTQSESAWVSK